MRNLEIASARVQFLVVCINAKTILHVQEPRANGTLRGHSVVFGLVSCHSLPLLQSKKAIAAKGRPKKKMLHEISENEQFNHFFSMKVYAEAVDTYANSLS